jgi:hypothetical protein
VLEGPRVGPCPVSRPCRPNKTRRPIGRASRPRPYPGVSSPPGQPCPVSRPCRRNKTRRPIGRASRPRPYPGVSSPPGQPCPHRVHARRHRSDRVHAGRHMWPRTCIPAKRGPRASAARGPRRHPRGTRPPQAPARHAAPGAPAGIRLFHAYGVSQVGITLGSGPPGRRWHDGRRDER